MWQNPADKEQYMNFSGKKLTISFYGYFSSLIIFLFIITGICERVLPTGGFVKCLIILSILFFFGGILVYIINESRQKPIISVILIAMILSLAGLYYFGKSDTDKYNLKERYVNRLLIYKNVPVKEGFEIKTAIDTWGLVHSFWYPMVKTGILKRNMPLVYSGFYLWLKDFHNYNLKEDTFRCFEPVSQKKSTQAGDIWIDGEKVRICLFANEKKKEYKWIYAPAGDTVSVMNTESYPGRGEVYRWKFVNFYEVKDNNSAENPQY